MKILIASRSVKDIDRDDGGWFLESQINKTNTWKQSKLLHIMQFFFLGGGERGGEIFLSKGPRTFLLFETTDSNIW